MESQKYYNTSNDRLLPRGSCHRSAMLPRRKRGVMSQQDFYPVELALAKAGDRLRRKVGRHTGLAGWKELSNSDRNRALRVFRDLALEQLVKTMSS